MSAPIRLLLMCGSIVLLHLFNFERLPEGGGLGWDGLIYAEMIRDQTVGNRYYAGRILPTLLLAPFGSSTAAIIRSFEIWNLLAILGSVLAWERIGTSLTFDDRRRWLGFLGVFFSFFLKQSLYYPVLVDPTALLTGLLLLMFHLENRMVAIALTAIAGSFCWPTAGFAGAALICCRGGKEIVPNKLLLVGLALAPIVALGFWLFPIPGHERESLSLATAIPSVALFGAMAAKLGVPQVRRILLGAMVVALPLIIQVIIADPTFHADRGTGIRILLHYCLLPAQIGMVFLPLVSLAIYYGPFFILAVLRWRQVVGDSKALGIGTVILLHLPLGLVTEPRYWMLVWPFVVVAVLKSLELSRRNAIIISLLCLAFSKIWLRINVAPWPPGELVGLDRYPKQMWFMNYGFWMSWPSFIMNGLITLAAAALLYWITRERRVAEPRA